MDKPKSLHGLEQEIIILQHLLEREKLKKAEELLVNRLVLTTIIFLIVFIILCIKVEYTRSSVQWLFFILYLGAGLVTLGFIAKSYYHEQDDARKAINNLKEILREKRGDYLYYLINNWH